MSDPLNWTLTSSTTPNSNAWTGVAYGTPSGSKRFVAVSSDGTNRVMYSDDGTNTWTLTTNTDTGTKNWNAITYGNGLYVAVGDGAVMYSFDGINTWPIVNTSPASDGIWNSITYGNGLFVAVGIGISGGTLMYSTNAITWTLSVDSVATTPGYQWNSITYANGTYVALGIANASQGISMYSTDGTTWTLGTGSISSGRWRSVVYGNGLFIAVSRSNGLVIYSSDGIAWTQVNTGFNYNWRSITYGNGLFVSVSSTIQSMYSTDGITWTLDTTIISTNFWESVTYGNNLFVSVARSGSSNRAMYAISKSDPTLSNFNVPDKVYGDIPFELEPPDSDSTGTFTYTSSNTDVATILLDVVTIRGGGSSTITATQAPTDEYNAGQIYTTFNVAPAENDLSRFAPIITFESAGPIEITPPETESTGAFTYSSSNTDVATIDGNYVTAHSVGRSIITAFQEATPDYDAAQIRTILRSNICFVAGTPIATDQGIIAIEKINAKIHTINNKKIIGITKIISTDKHLVCFEKHSLKFNIPSKKTIMSRNHGIFFNETMTRAKDFIGAKDGIYNVDYNDEILYNVLMEEHSTMKVNNLICETLDPKHDIAKAFLRNAKKTNKTLTKSL